MKSLAKTSKIYASCPGKILISGGYSILKEENIGMSLALEARFYVTSRIFENNAQDGILIKFFSPQISSEWIYQITDFKDHLVLREITGNKNPFLESIIKIFFSFVKTLDLCLDKKSVEVDIFNDQDFYSENCIKEGSSKKEKFPIFELKNLKKTGIGSSACLIVSVLSSLTYYWDLQFSDMTPTNFSWVHLLSQIANILAQNKIGSGFDISTAMYGSQIFQKFPEKLVSEKLLTCFNEMKDFEFIKVELIEVMKKFKEFEQKIIKIPNINLKTYLMDFSTGSDTRILVGKVKEYLKLKNETIEKFYNDSNEMTKNLMEFFEFENKDLKMQEKNENYRNVMKELGVKSNVEIEPDVITIILDFMMKIEKNVVYCICPGAGGYDAACFLVKEDCQINLADFNKKMEELKEGVNIDFVRENYQKKEKFFVNSFEDLMKKLKKTEIKIMEKKIDKEGLKLVEF